MSNKLIISKTKKLTREIDAKTQYILVGQWIQEEFDENEIKKYKFLLPKPAFYEKKARSQSYEECEKIFNSIFEDFYKKLNHLHKKNLSKRAWRIIAESWLKRFIYICFNRKHTLDLAFKEYDVDEVFLKNHKDFLFFTKDCEGQYPASVNNIWNSNLYYKLLKYFNFNVKISEEFNNEKIINFQSYFERIKKLEKSKKYKFFQKVFFLNKFLSKKKENLIFNSYLPFLYEKLIEIFFFQFPQFRREKNFSFKSLDSNIRSKLSFIKNNNIKNIENFIRQILPDAIPISFLESFNELYETNGHENFPENPNFIFISTGFDHDELLKFYIAKNIDKGKKYYVGQHGATYFTEHDANYRAEVNTSDKFFTWGYHHDKNKKLIPCFNLKTFNKKYYPDQNGAFTIVCRSLGYRAVPWDRYHEGISGMKKISNLMNLISPKIREKSIIRLHKSYNLKRANFFLKKYFNDYKKNLEFGNISYKKLLLKSRLICFNYDSTGFLENLSVNFPSIAIFDKNLNHLNEKFSKKYEILLDANIIFVDEYKLNTHLLNIWENISDWWNSKKVQNSIKEFNYNFNNTGSIKDFRELLNNLKDE